MPCQEKKPPTGGEMTGWRLALAETGEEKAWFNF
jgi:hypothetical protein